MDTLEWMLWPARWAILTIGLLAQLAALALAMRRAAARTCATPSPLRIRLPESSAAPGSGPGDDSPSVTVASVLRISRGLLLTGGGLVAVFALLERDMLLLAGQALVLPLLWPRLR